MMFNEVPFLERFSAAADAGFHGVEYLFPYDYPVEAIEDLLRRHSLENVLFNLPPGNWAAGERGTTCLPGREAEFRAGVQTAIAYATRLKTTRVHAMAGIVPPGADPAAVHAAYIANLKYAAAELAAARHHPADRGHQHARHAGLLSQHAGAIVRRDAGSGRAQPENADGLLPHADHGGRYRREAAQVRAALRARAGGGRPERHEPDTGEVRYPYLFELLDTLGYDGWVGCEYRPAGKTVDGLGWFRSLAAA